jgi:hypothetical protein
MVHPTLYEEIRKQPDKDILEPAIGMCFPTPEARRQTNAGWPAAVAKYLHRSNSEDLLSEKAGALSVFITNNLDVGRTAYAEAMKKNIDLTDDQDMQLQLEEAACWYRVIDQLAHQYIGADRPLFMDYLGDQLVRLLALQGAAPDAICATMDARLKEYAQYKELAAKEGQGTSGTVLWEAAKHVGSVFGDSDKSQARASRHPVFLLTFAVMFMQRLQQALIYELLRGRAPGRTGAS